MKVVINGCYGGYSLSAEAEAAYLARQGKQTFFYAEDRQSAPRPGDRDLVKVAIEDVPDAFITFTSTRDFGDRVDSKTFWGDKDGAQEHPWYWNDRDLKRDDPDLVAVVEELGDKADGRHARLHVVEIPDGIEYIIEEYDGIEHIAEAHRTWS